MKIVIKPEDNDLLLKLDQEIQDGLAESDLKKLHGWLVKNYEKLVTSSNNKIIFSKLFNNLDETLETLSTRHKDLITNTKDDLALRKEELSGTEEQLLWGLKIISILLQKRESFELFNSLERVIELIPITRDFKILRKALGILDRYISKTRRKRDQLGEHKDRLARMIHNVSMIALHSNLYSQKSQSFIELLSDDPKFKEYNARQGGKFSAMKYKDNLEFEYYIPHLLKTQEEDLKQNAPENSLDSENVKISIEDLNSTYPNDTHYTICKKLITEKNLNIEESSPIFDALLFRVRIAQNFEKYQKRVEIIETALTAISLLDALRKHAEISKRYESFIYQTKDLVKILEEGSDLLNLQATPSLHKRVIRLLLNVAHRDSSLRYRAFFASKFGHTGDLHLGFKDLTSLELKGSEKEVADETQKISFSLRSLILPKETALKSSVLIEMLKLVNEIIERYYFEDRRRVLSPDIESLSHVVSSIMNLIGSSSIGSNYFLYSKKNILLVFEILRKLIFQKDFVREFKIIETLVEFGEGEFKTLIDNKKCFVRKDSQWELLSQEDLIEILIGSIKILSDYFLPMGRYASRAEMAPTVARKVAESGIIRCSVVYLEREKDVNPALFREIMSIVSEICRESQTVVPRLVEAGVIELIMKRVQNTFTESEDIGDTIQLVSNVCLQDTGRDLERKYKLLELFFDAFTSEKFETLNEKWFKMDAKKGHFRKDGQIDKVERELVYIAKYVNGYGTIITSNVTKIANFLITEGENKLKELGSLKASLTENKEKTLENTKLKFSYYLYKLHNFLGIFGRFLRESRIRGPILEEGGFNTLLKLLAIHQIFAADFKLTQTNVVDAFHAIIDKELQNSENNILNKMEKVVTDELGSIEKITGPLKNLEDFSKFFTEPMLLEISKNSVLEGLIEAEGGILDAFLILRSLCLLSIVLNALVLLKLGSTDLSEKLFHIYKAYSKTSLKHSLSQASQLKKEIQEYNHQLEDEKQNKIKNLIDTVSDDKKDVLSRGHSFMAKIKAFLDQCAYFDLANPSKSKAVNYSSLILQMMGDFKDLKEVPAELEEKIIFVVKANTILNYLFQVISNQASKQKLFQTSLPTCAFDLFEEGAFEFLAEKLFLIVKLATEELSKSDTPIKPEEKGKNELLQRTLGNCIGKVNVIYEKFFFPTLDQTSSALFRDKVIQGVELTEYINCVLLGHLKLLLPSFDLVSDACAKIATFNEKKEKKPKEQEEEKKDGTVSQEEKVDKNLEKLFTATKTALKQFTELSFKNLSRIFRAKQGAPAVSSSRPVAEDRKDPAVEKIITDLCEMGFDRKVAELCTRKIQYLNISLALDWIANHPEEVEKVEKSLAAASEEAKKEEKPQEISLGATKIERVTYEEYLQTISGELEKFNDKLISNLPVLEGYERGVIKFIRKSIEFYEKNNKKGYAQRISVIVMKLFKDTVNHFFKSTKYISSLKVPKTIDKDLGQEVLKSYTSTKASTSGKLRNLELVLLWFIKLKSFIPNFEKNFLRSNFLTELMNFHEAVLSSSSEYLSANQGDKEESKVFDQLKKINHSMLRIFNMIFARKQTLEPESSDRKTSKSIDEEKKSATLKETKPQEAKTQRKNSIRPKKSPLEVVVGVTALANQFLKKNSSFVLFDEISLRNLLELLLALLNENQDNHKQFIKLNGLSELLKLKANTYSNSPFLNDLSVMFMNLIEEPSLIIATLEAKVKAYMTKRLKQNPDLPLAEFINYFKNVCPRHHKQLVEVIQKICIVYAKEADPIPAQKGKKRKSKAKSPTKEQAQENKDEKDKEKEKEKEKVATESKGSKASTLASKLSPTEIIQRRLIKLKDSVDVGKLECPKRTSEKRKKKSVEEIDLSEASPSLPYTPSQNISQVLNVLIESIVCSFNEKTETFAAQGKDAARDDKQVFPYHALIKVLGLICTEHPLLLPYILNYNCAHLIEEGKEYKLSLLKKYAEKPTFTFLSYYVRVVNYIGLDKLRYFLVAIASGRDTLVQNSEGNVVLLGEEVAKEIVKEMIAILQAEISRSDFLDTAESVQSFCSVSFLLVALLPVRQILKVILDWNEENKHEPELLRLYVRAIKRLQLKNYYKLENVLPFILDSSSALIQYYNYVSLKPNELNLNDKFMAANILVKHNFREVWESLLRSQNDVEGQLDAQPERNRHYQLSDDPVRNFFTRVLEIDEEPEDDEEDMRGFMARDVLRRQPAEFREFREEVDLGGSSDEEGDNEIAAPYMHHEGEDWQEGGEQSLGSDEIEEDEPENLEPDLYIPEGEEVDEEDEEANLAGEVGMDMGLTIERARDWTGERRRSAPELDAAQADEGDYDEEMNEKSERSATGPINAKREAQKLQSFAAQIQLLLEEGNVHDADLRNINNSFVDLFYRLEEPTAVSLTINNPVQYETTNLNNPQAPGDLNLYTRIYHHLAADLISRSIPDAGQPSYWAGADRNSLGLRGRDDLDRNAVFRMLEEGINEGWSHGALYQNIVRRYAHVLNDNRERARAEENQGQPRLAQPQATPEQVNNFITDILHSVEQDVPAPPVVENQPSDEVEEEEEEEAEVEETAEKQEQERAANELLSAQQIASILQSVSSATLRTGQSQNAESPALQNQQASVSQANGQPGAQEAQREGEAQPQEERKEEENAQAQAQTQATQATNVESQAGAQGTEEAKVQEGGDQASTFKLSDYGIDAAFVEGCGIDMSIFDMLPDEEKVELILQLIDQNNVAGDVPAESQNAEPVPSQQAQSGSNIASNNAPVQNNAENQPAEEGKAQEPQNAGSQPAQPLNPDASGQAAVAGENNAGAQQGEAQAGGAQPAGGQEGGAQPGAPAQENPIGIDPELLANLDQLPEDLRLEILQQQNQLLQQSLFGGANAAAAGGMNAGQDADMDIGTFLETLDPSLRQEILATSDQNFIDSLPSHLAAEAQIIRDNQINRHELGGYQGGHGHARGEISEPPLNFIERKLQKEKKEEGLNQEKRERLFESDEKLIESLLKLLYVEPSKFNNFPFDLLVALSQHPKNEYRIFDTLMFLLKNISPQRTVEEDPENKEASEIFPPRALFEKNRIIKDKETIHKQVSPQILFILHCLTQTRSDYFVEDREKEGTLELPKMKRNESLDSIKALKAEMQISESHPLYDLLKLCSSESIIQNSSNVILLVNIIENICKNPKIFKTLTDTIEEEKQEEEGEGEGENKEKEKVNEEEEEKKEAPAAEDKDKKKKASKKEAEKEEIYLCKYKLDEQSVMSFCKLLYSENLSNALISRLSFIIGVFCQEKHNLNLFIKVMKEILYKVSLESNRFLEEKLIELKNMSAQITEQADENTQDRVKSLLNELVAKFGNQVLILRIAKIIKFLYENTVTYLTRSKERERKEDDKQSKRKGSLKDELYFKAKEEILKSLETIMLDDNLKAFWINVSECVHLINERLTKSWDVQNLLNVNVRPIIESFFIIHKILNDDEFAEFAKNQKKSTKATIAEIAPSEDLELEMELEQAPKLGRGFSEMRKKKLDPNEIFAFICDKNKKVINNMIKQDFNLLNDSMSMIAKKVPKILDFEIRRAYFRKEMSKMQRPGSIRLRVKRQTMMENSFSQLFSRNADELRRKLHIEFIGEEGMDAGGVSREWFLELSKQVFNANYNLFIPSANGNTFQPSLISDPENLNYFKFIGKFIAKALFDKQLLECYFTRSFYKHILGQPINYHDIEDVDPDYYKSLKWILENDITQAGLDLNMSYEFDKFGQTVVEDLIPNGQNIPVTEANKKEYVHRISNQKMARGIKAQIEFFLSGFFELIPKNLIAIFDSKELELLISGLPDIDIVDLKENTEYHGYDANSQIIRWFWEILEDMEHTQRANLLQFVTGTSKVPLEGFKVLRGISGPQKFQIHKAGDPNALPTGHTCFNQLDLPEYTSKEQLKTKLLLAVTEGKEGFGFA